MMCCHRESHIFNLHFRRMSWTPYLNTETRNLVHNYQVPAKGCWLVALARKGLLTFFLYYFIFTLLYILQGLTNNTLCIRTDGLTDGRTDRHTDGQTGFLNDFLKLIVTPIHKKRLSENTTVCIVLAAGTEIQANMQFNIFILLP